MSAADKSLVEQLRVKARVNEERGLSFEIVNEAADLIEAQQAEIERLRGLVRILQDNDPSEPIADNGMTVLDQWRTDARTALNEGAK